MATAATRCHRCMRWATVGRIIRTTRSFVYEAAACGSGAGLGGALYFRFKNSVISAARLNVRRTSDELLNSTPL